MASKLFELYRKSVMGNGWLGEYIEPGIQSMSVVDTGNDASKATAETKNTGTGAGTCAVPSDAYEAE